MKISFVYWLLLALISNSAMAQSTCSITASSVIPKDAATWNWEEPKSNPGSTLVRPEYCNTWNAFIAPGASAPFKVSMSAPWESASGPLLAVGLGFDYQKANGWELLKLDFGGGTRAIAAPYFVLYQKSTGTLRVYAYINSPGILTGIVFTMKHSGTNTTYSGQSTANLSLSRYPVVAPDKYLSQPASDPVSSKEVLTYVSFYGGGQQWAMGQFNMLLDPNISNSVYNLNALQFQIFGLVKSEVKINGSFQFTTDYAMSGPASNVTPPSDPYKILANGQRFLGNLSSVTDKITEVGKKANDFKRDIGVNPQYVAKNLADISSKVEDVTKNVTLLKTISDFSGTFGGFFSLTGSIIGLLTGDSGSAGKSAFVPTSSKGTIELTGSLTVETPLVTFSMLVPGTNHYASSSGSTVTPSQYYTQLPYYNCALGIFNIKNTPVLKKVTYQRYARAHSQYPDFSQIAFKSSDPIVSCTSYRLNSRIIPVVNTASGLVIKSVKYAICQVIPLSDVMEPYWHRYDDGFPFAFVRDYKFIYSQVANGALEVYPYEPSSSNSVASVIVQTPFTDASCPPANGLPFNGPTPLSNSPVFVRVIAELVPPGIFLKTAPVYFSQDYAVTLVDDPNSSSYQGQVYAPGKIPPYNLENNGTSAITISPYASSPTEPTVTKSGQLSYGGSFYGTSSSPIGQVANSTLIFDDNSAVAVSPRVSNSNYPFPVVFRAQNDVQIKGTLNVADGTDFIISTELATVSSAAEQAIRPCYQGYSQFESLNQQCGYDTNATSKVALATQPTVMSTESMLVTFPNPASNIVTAQLLVSENECIERMDLINTSGQINWQRAYSCVHKIATDIPVAGFAQGLYILQVKTDKRVYSTKLSIE